jgi:hypothetical protein
MSLGEIESPMSLGADLPVAAPPRTAQVRSLGRDPSARAYAEVGGCAAYRSLALKMGERRRTEASTVVSFPQIGTGDYPDVTEWSFLAA